MLNKIGLSLRFCIEKLQAYLWGSRLVEKQLVKALARTYQSRLKIDWHYTTEKPHFFEQRIGLFNLAFSSNVSHAYNFFRGFYSAEAIKQGDVVLDIGCGEGFYTKRFFSERCREIDAIDVEPSAIAYAKRYNSSPKVTYMLKDAVIDDFPRKYNVVIWDGAIGHFSPDVLNQVLVKISGALTETGIFVGSESLGVEGHDHLQFFSSSEDLFSVFKPYFKHVQIKEQTYPITGGVRREGYWRCSNNRSALDQLNWKNFQNV
jgi:SAM-dependent methyltransferase